jgi:hypothetical protein
MAATPIPEMARAKPAQKGITHLARAPMIVKINGETLGLAPFVSRGYADDESCVWSLCARCGQMKVLA